MFEKEVFVKRPVVFSTSFKQWRRAELRLWMYVTILGLLILFPHFWIQTKALLLLAEKSKLTLQSPLKIKVLALACMRAARMNAGMWENLTWLSKWFWIGEFRATYKILKVKWSWREKRASDWKKSIRLLPLVLRTQNFTLKCSSNYGSCILKKKKKRKPTWACHLKSKIFYLPAKLYFWQSCSIIYIV